MALEMPPPGYEIVETPDRVGHGPEARSWFRWHADRVCARLTAGRLIPSYRYEVVREGRRWAVYAFQNVLRKLEP